MNFIESIYEKAKQNKRVIGVPEFDNQYMLKAAVRAQQDGLADIVLVGEPEKIAEKAKEFGENIEGLRIVNPKDEAYMEELLDKYDKSPKKVMTRKFVSKRIGHPLYLATLLEAVGVTDATIAGVDTTTYEFVMAANSIIGLEPGCKTASGLLFLEAPDFEGEQGTIFAMGDGAVCVDPTAEQSASIAIAACETFETVVGREARCALISYSTDGSGGDSPAIRKAQEAVALAKEQRPDLKIDGEFQADAAIDLRVGKKKVKRDSDVAGRANVLIFPEAAAANSATKLLKLLCGVTTYGPLYQGYRLPILDCSRSDTDAELYNDMAFLSVLATAKLGK